MEEGWVLVAKGGDPNDAIRVVNSEGWRVIDLKVFTGDDGKTRFGLFLRRG